MKILLVNNDKRWRGGQEFLLDLGREFRENGIDVHFVVREGSPSQERFIRDGFTVYAVRRSGVGAMASVVQLAGIMRRERFDIVSIAREHDISLTVLARYLAFPLGRPGKLVMNYHISVMRRQPFLGVMDAIVCVSSYIRHTLLTRYPAVAARTRVLHNGIALPPPPSPGRYSVCRERRLLKGMEFPIIGMVGAFFKNQGELVDCMPRLMEVFPGISVVFAGDDTDLPHVVPVKDKIRGLGLEERIVFTGKLGRDQINDLFHDLDLSVSTFRNEGFGLVHLESLAAGTPVVTYREGGQVDFLREGGGVLVDGGTDEFARAVTDILLDSDRRSVLGREGRALVERSYSLQETGAAYLELFHELLSR